MSSCAIACVTEMRSFPNWVGTDQRRVIGWEGARLTLTTPVTAFGGRQVGRLVWERAEQR